MMVVEDVERVGDVGSREAWPCGTDALRYHLPSIVITFDIPFSMTRYFPATEGTTVLAGLDGGG